MLAYSASGLGGKKTARGPLFVNTVSITEIFANGFHYFSNKKAVCFLLDRKGLLLRTLLAEKRRRSKENRTTP